MLSHPIDSSDESLLSFDSRQTNHSPIMTSSQLSLIRYGEACLSPPSAFPSPDSPHDKGKGVSKSLPIDALPSSSHSLADSLYMLSTSPPEHISSFDSQPSTSFGSSHGSYDAHHVGMPVYSFSGDPEGKGKEKQDPPQLPPLSFGSGHFLIDGLEWAASPSHTNESTPDHPIFHLDAGYPSRHIYTPPNSPEVGIDPKSLPPRRQSLPGSLAELKSVSSPVISDDQSSPTVPQFLASDGVLLKLQYDLPPYHPKFKGHSYASPSPVMDVTVHFEPLPVPVLAPSYFDCIIPKEIHLAILRAVVDNAIDAYDRRVSSEQWSALKAASPKNRWAGISRGLRELVKLSRVSKTWHTLAFDGKLWDNFAAYTLPTMPKTTLLHAAKMAGSFVHSLNLTGLRIDTEDMLTIANSFCLKPTPGHTQLTSIILPRIDIEHSALNHLLTNAPSLLYLNVRGSKAMRKSTCRVLAQHCPRLLTMDASRCKHLDGDGIYLLCSETLSQGRTLALKELRLSGMNGPHRAMFEQLGKAAHLLEVLDLSYVKQMHNSYLEALVSITPQQTSSGVPYVTLTPLQAGKKEHGYYFRRVTKLQHLNLSSCVLLTDIACTNLAFSVPDLELLELAGIGQSLVDEGIIHLLETTPHIRCLDLEEATSITDRVIQALTPIATPPPRRASGPPIQPGQELEQLNLSFIPDISHAALQALLRACPRLRVIEVDNTNIISSFIREFVSLSRDRKLQDAKIVAVDCRSTSERLFKELSSTTRPRKGWRAYEARRLHYIDARDGATEDCKGAQDECNPDLVVLKSFFSWQAVDSIATARAKQRSARKAEASFSSEDESSDDVYSRRRGGRWWSSGRRLPLSGRSSPTSPTRDGCILM